MHIVPGSAVIFVLSNMCSEISASCLETSLEHFKHLIEKKNPGKQLIRHTNCQKVQIINILFKSIGYDMNCVVDDYFYCFFQCKCLNEFLFFQFLLKLHVLNTILHDSFNRMSSLGKQDL